MGEDEELERIKQRRLRELVKQASGKERRIVEKRERHAVDKPVEVNDSTFAKAIRELSLVVVDCWAGWCAPCRMIAPVIEELAKDYAGKILFGKLNVDENQEIAMKYEIMTIPTLLVFKNGELVDRIIGAMPRQTLEPKITRFL